MRFRLIPKVDMSADMKIRLQDNTKLILKRNKIEIVDSATLEWIRKRIIKTHIIEGERETQITKEELSSRKEYVSSNRFSISLLTPTRERVDKCCRYINSIVSTASDPSRIEALFYVDDDDPQLSEYRSKLPQAGKKLGNLQIVSGPFITVSREWNVLAELCQGNALAMGNDDIIYCEKGWDDRLEKEAKAFPHNIWCMWFADGITNSELWPTFPIISRRYYEELGYFSPEPIKYGYKNNFLFFYNDTWVGDVSKKAGCQKYISSPQYMKHLHWSTYKKETDSTTHRARNLAKQGNDTKTFDETEYIRKDHADILINSVRG